ncbi:MAG TPA: outer membrane protein assembly factor BamC [Burkholderiaceae bacterium]|nr:outer membrane protein assembly factor BamC [Burkholderiaceae bacterium]
MRLKKHATAVVVGLSLLALSGCSLNKFMSDQESVNYKSTVAGEPLTIPPDLTQADSNPHYRAPEGMATYSKYAQSQAARNAQNADNAVLPNTPGMKVMRDGDIHWLVVDQPAQSIYPKVVEFWGDQGFTIHNQDPKAGLIQTDWAENRAKIPEGWIRSALGGLLDQVFDSGERDRFRTRIERVNGHTEIYISHQHMVEKVSPDFSTSKWVPGKEDQGLNAAMLARLMVYLGTNVNEAHTLIAQAVKDPTQTKVQAQTAGQSADLTVSEPFDRAWRRVGIALDSAGFSVDDRDRSAGDYYISYLDTDTGVKIEQQTFIGRLFGTKNTAAPTKYRLHVAQQSDGTSSLVTVLDANGKRDDSATAKRIITVLSQHMGTPSGS